MHYQLFRGRQHCCHDAGSNTVDVNSPVVLCDHIGRVICQHVCGKGKPALHIRLSLGGVVKKKELHHVSPTKTTLYHRAHMYVISSGQS